MSSLQRDGKTRWKPSYLRRQGHMTKAQKRYFREFWPTYGVDLPYESRLNPTHIFQQDQPLILEIGFGQGESLLHRAQLEPEHNFLAVEVHKPAIASVLKQVDDLKLSNIRLVRKDALLLLADHLVQSNLKEIWILFPEPWHDPKEHHRRILRPFTLELLHPHLIDGTQLYFATDVQEYAQAAFQQLCNQAGWQHTQSIGDFSRRPDWRQVSKYERKGLTAGRSVFDISFTFQTSTG